MIFILIGIGIWSLGTSLFQQQILDYKFADMLPIIEIMGQRWINGQEVYATIPEIWGGMQPIYLPAMWLPYTSMIALGVDLRFMNLIFILLSIFFIFDLLNFKNNKPSLSLLILVPLLILLSYIFIDYSTLITISEEPIVIGFYVFLGYAVIKNKPILILVALSFCIMSRYSLVFWAITYIAYTFFQISKSKALIIGIGSGLFCLFLLYISQGIYQLELFHSLKSAYLETLTNHEKAGPITSITQKNIGLARFFSFEQLPHLHNALFWGSILLPPILYSWYHYFGRQWVKHEWFALCCLKLSLVYFFNMNALPFSYLFYTSTFLSLIIIFQYSSRAVLKD